MTSPTSPAAVVVETGRVPETTFELSLVDGTSELDIINKNNKEDKDHCEPRLKSDRLTLPDVSPGRYSMEVSVLRP